MRRYFSSLVRKAGKIADYKTKGVGPYAESPIEKLPLDIWLRILEELRLGDPVMLFEFFSRAYVLANLCLVNRRFNRFFTPILYYQFDLNGYARQLKSLWYFLRTLVERPDLAEHVRESRMSLSWPGKQLWESRQATSLNLKFLYKENKACFEQAARQAQFDKAEYKGRNLVTYAQDSITSDFGVWSRRSSKDGPAMETTLFTSTRAPLVALVLAHCPNLTRLDFSCLSLSRDPFFPWLVRCAAGGTDDASSRPGLPFQHLESFSLFPQLKETNDDYRDLSNVGQSRASDEDFPYYRLPGLRNLELYPIRALKHNNPKEHLSALESLRLNCFKYSDLECVSLHSIFKAFHNLRQLSLDLIIKKDSLPHCHKPVWDLLHCLKNQLTYLDLKPTILWPGRFRDYLPPNEQTADSTCPCLSGFTNLRVLKISAYHLLGYDCDHKTPSKMQSHVPPNLECLGLYTAYQSLLAEAKYGLDMETELEGLVLSGRCLRSIIVGYDDDLPFGKMKAAAAQNSIFFKGDGWKCLCAYGSWFQASTKSHAKHGRHCRWCGYGN